MEKKTISNMVIENSFDISISRDDAYRIERMLEKICNESRHPKAKYILEIVSAKIKYAAFQGYDTKVDISYKEACDIYNLIKAFIDSSDIAEDRKDDDNAVFGEDAIAWERLIDVLDYIEENP